MQKDSEWAIYLFSDFPIIPDLLPLWLNEASWKSERDQIYKLDDSQFNAYRSP